MDLSPAERRRFAEWLEREALTDGILIEQMKKLFPDNHPILRQYESQKAATELVLKKLTAPRESMTLGAPTPRTSRAKPVARTKPDPPEPVDPPDESDDLFG